MQTIYYTTASFIRHTGNVVDLEDYRRKLALTQEYRLYGVGYWNLMRPFPQNWRVLNSLYQILD